MGTRPIDRVNIHKTPFTLLLKSPAEIYATSEGKATLGPPSQIFTPPHHRDRARYCEFHGDHGHDTNSCVVLRKEIETCIRNGRLSHLAKGARAQKANQNPSPYGIVDRGKNHIEWPRKVENETKPPNEILMTNVEWCPFTPTEEVQYPLFKISFSNSDPTPENNSRDDPLIIKANIGNTTIHRIYVDGGNSAEIMYDHCFQLLTNEQKATMQPPTTPLVGFVGQLSWPLGVITLPLTMFDYKGRGSKTFIIKYIVVCDPSPYNAILVRPGMRQLGAIVSTIHSLKKFPIHSGIAVVRGYVPSSKMCMEISRKRERGFSIIASSISTEQQSGKEYVTINQHYPDQQIAIGTSLSMNLAAKLRKLLCENQDIFAWSPSDMSGIYIEFAEHKLNVHPRTFPIRQKKREVARERNEAVNQEVAKLVDARILKEVFFPRWVANPVMVRKSDGSWRMHIDFTNLNHKQASSKQE